MIAVDREITDFVHLGFQFISHQILHQCAWILAGILIQESSNYWPKFSSNGHHLTIQINHLPKLLCSKTAVNRTIKHLSDPMFYSTNPQTNLRHQSVLSKEWDHQVWCQSNHVWVNIHWLEDDQFNAMKSGQISCSSFSLLHTLWSVFCTF
jgi:hypothetical protein